LRALGTACLAVYLSAGTGTTLYERACRVAGDRASSLLRTYLQPGTTDLRAPIPADDRELFAQSARECLALAAWPRD
jgi:hypothetical protein